MHCMRVNSRFGLFFFEMSRIGAKIFLEFIKVGSHICNAIRHKNKSSAFLVSSETLCSPVTPVGTL
jgi:hypothetical protein